MNYEKLYHLLFNAITDALEQMEKQNYGSAKDLLITAQQKTEEIYIITESYPRRRAKQCRRRPRSLPPDYRHSRLTIVRRG